VPEIPIGVPSTLLERRPDVAAAERRVAAANTDIGVARAAFFPTFSLSANGNSTSSVLGDLFATSANTWSLGLSAAQTLFDAGARKARVEQSRAAYDATAADYRQTALTAFEDVENQLTAARTLERQYALQLTASQAADQTEQMLLNQYKAGQVAYTDVVTAQASALSARRTLVQTAVSRQTTAVAWSRPWAEVGPATAMRFNKPLSLGPKVGIVLLTVFALAVACILAPRALGRVSPIWFANAVVLCVYLRSPGKHWPLITVAGLAGNILANLIAGDSVALLLVLGAANAMESLTCALLIRRVVGRDFDISRMAHLLQFAMAATASACGAAVIASAGLGLFNGEHVLSSLIIWALGDLLGFLTLAPCLLLLTQERGQDEPKFRQQGWTLAVLVVVVSVTFIQSRYPLLFLVPPALLLVTWRLELFGSALGVLITALIGIALSLVGYGPIGLIHGDATERVIVLQAFLAISILASLPIANQRAVARKLQASLAGALRAAEGQALKLDTATTVARLGHWTLDIQTGAFTWSRQMYEIFGIDPNSDADLSTAMAMIHPDDAPECQRLLDRATAHGEDYFQDQIRIFRPGGEMRLTGGHVVCQRDESGVVVALFGTLTDHTDAKLAEMQRTHLEGRYAEIAAKASDIVLRLDPERDLPVGEPGLQVHPRLRAPGTRRPDHGLVDPPRRLRADPRGAGGPASRRRA
jgi:integral membrane sensor domain MASE1